VDTDDKKKDRFLIGLSTKLQECMVLNTRMSFPEFVSNVINVDYAIRAHKETKTRKVVATPSGSASLRYQMVYHHGPTYPPHHNQHQRQHQQAAPKALPNAAQGHVTHPPRGHQKVVIAKTSHANYTTMEDIPEGDQVLMICFL
jgi:hypothetical protein